MNAFEDRLRAGLRSEPAPIDANSLIRSVERKATRRRRLQVSAGVAAVALTVVGCVGVALAVSTDSQTEAPLLNPPSEQSGGAAGVYNYEPDDTPVNLKIQFETGLCELVGLPSVAEDAETVRLTVPTYPDIYSKGCPIPEGATVAGGTNLWSATVQLAKPLGDRRLIDTSSGRKIPLWDRTKYGSQ